MNSSERKAGIPPSALCPLGDVIEAIGTKGFPSTLLRVVNEYVDVDHVAVFTFTETKGFDYLLTHGRIADNRAHELARSYTREFHHFDPYAGEAANPGKPRKPHWVRFAPKKIAHPDYLNFFYDRNDLVDKLSLIFRRDETAYYCSFYRLGDSGRYLESETEALSGLSSIIVASVAKHGSALFPENASAARLALDGWRGGWPKEAGLAPREIEVCNLILEGYGSEAIALELGLALNSVKTYRKRAYAKLNISSQNELFMLYLGRGKAH